MKVAIVYDCLFPWRIGGAERWYRSLAEELSRRGHDVVYLTRREWDEAPSLSFAVVGVSGRRADEIYTQSGRRKILPTLKFGFGVWRYLRAHRDVDVVHAGSFPFFSIFGIRASRFGRGRPPLVVDVVEVWPAAYWRSYAGRVVGTLGWLIERTALLLADRRFTFTRRQAEMLRHDVAVLPGLFDGAVADHVDAPSRDAAVLFVGRLITEKGAHLVPPAIEVARRAIPDLRCVVIGDGPERARLESAIAARGLEASIELRGFVDDDQLAASLRSAACLLLPSSREGYGLIVVEAAALGTPTLTLHHDQNAAGTLIEPGVNGWLVEDERAETWAAAIVEAVRSAADMKLTAWEWGKRKAEEASVARSADVIVNAYDACLRRR
jgi:glycosyltransferase involved in cell wall biosynthesis